MPQAPPSAHAPCPICESSQRRRLYDLHDTVWQRPGVFGLVECQSCGVAYLSPRPAAEHIEFYYQDLYAGEGLDFEETINHGRIGAWINRSRVRALQRRSGGVAGRHLDVGCGLGGFLRQARARGVVREAVGVDFDSVAIDTARSRTADVDGLEFHAGSLAEQTLTGEFDSASMIHFLEHSFVPLQEVQQTHRLLKPGGALVVEVPSARAWARRVFRRYWLPHLAPQHITLFSPKTLRTTLESAGFTEVDVKDCFAPLVWFSSFVLWYQHTIGTKSRWKNNVFAKIFTILFTLVALLPLLAWDAFLSVAVRLFGGGDHIRATAIKPSPEEEKKGPV